MTGRTSIQVTDHTLTISWPLTARLRRFLPAIAATFLWYPLALPLLGWLDVPPSSGWFTLTLAAPVLGMVVWVPALSRSLGRRSLHLEREGETLKVAHAIATHARRSRVCLDPLPRGRRYRVTLHLYGFERPIHVDDLPDRDRALALASALARFLGNEVDEAAIIV